VNYFTFVGAEAPGAWHDGLGEFHSSRFRAGNNEKAPRATGPVAQGQSTPRVRRAGYRGLCGLVEGRSHQFDLSLARRAKRSRAIWRLPSRPASR
jgi:hypothetical protein